MLKGTDISIAFKGIDNMSGAMREIRKNTQGLSRDIAEYRKIQADAFSQKVEAKLDITKAKQQLKELEKAVREEKEGSLEALRKKQEEIEVLAERYKRLGQIAADCGKEEHNLTQEMSKRSNSHQDSYAMGSLAKAGLGKMLADSTGKLLETSISSAFGQNIGGAISEVVGGALSGAALGSIAGPLGTAIGAAVGGLAGGMNVGNEYLTRKDDMYRQEVKGVYADFKTAQSQDKESGILYSSSKEKNLKSLETLLGSKEKGDNMFADIKTYGTNTPYQTPQMLDSAKQMLAYGISEDELMGDIKMLGDIGLGDQNKFNSLSYAYAQIQSAGILRGQDLLQLTSAGFNPLQVLADEYGNTLQQMREYMSDGKISAEDVTEAMKLATQEGGRYYNAAYAQMETYSGKMSLLDELKSELQGSMGDGYTQTRKTGIEKEIEYIKGPMGEKMSEAYNLIGVYQADLENNYHQAVNNAMSNAMTGDDYKKALAADDGAEMGRIIAEAKAKAEIEHRNSDLSKRQYDADKSLVSDIQEMMIGDKVYQNYGMEMANEFSKGWQSGFQKYMSENSEPRKVDKGWHLIDGSTSYNNYLKKGSPNGYATGLERVPYNGFEAILHEGEKVLTKAEAEKGQKPMTIQQHITNHFATPTNDVDIEAIALKICSELVKAADIYGGEY
ncbi:MAG: tape measure protein [Oscillospiraceae bacterium]